MKKNHETINDINVKKFQKTNVISAYKLTRKFQKFEIIYFYDTYVFFSLLKIRTFIRTIY